MTVAHHRAQLKRVDALIGTRTYAGRVTAIRRLRWQLSCSCGTDLGHALDWIDAKHQWRDHKERVRC